MRPHNKGRDAIRTGNHPTQPSPASQSSHLQRRRHSPIPALHRPRRIPRRQAPPPNRRHRTFGNGRPPPRRHARQARTDTREPYWVYEWLPRYRHVIGNGGAVNWNEGPRSKLPSKLNRLVRRTKGYTKIVEMLKPLLAIALEESLNQFIKSISAAC